MAIKLNEREYRAFSNFEYKEDENRGFYVEGYSIIFDKETVLYTIDGIDYKEKIARNALNSTDISDVIMNYNHGGKVVARTRNKTLQLSIDSNGLFNRGKLDGTEEGRKLYEEVKGGYLDKMSFAFTVVEDEYDRNTHTRTIKKIGRLFDVSIVSIPAYNQTSISARSFFELENEKERKALDNAILRKKILIKTKI